MILGFDWGGTLEVNEPLRAFLRRMFIEGHTIHIIPHLGHVPQSDADVLRAYRQGLQSLNLPYHGLHRLGAGPENNDDVPGQKLAKVRELRCEYFWDDRADTCERICSTLGPNVRTASDGAWPGCVAYLVRGTAFPDLPCSLLGCENVL